MAKYRIKKEELPSDEAHEDAQPWQKVSAGDFLHDLDPNELKELNKIPEYEEINSSSSHGRIVSVLIIALFGFVFLIFSNFMYFGNAPDLSFLIQSGKLQQNEELQALKESVVLIQAGSSLGSGFNISPDGLIVTNRHVVENSNAITICFPDGSVHKGTVKELITQTDLALLTINGEDLPYLTLADDLPKEGDEVVFIGNPLGFEWVISQGQFIRYVQLNSQDPIQYLYIEGPVRSGSSGSPVFNAQNQVVGIIFASIQDQTNTGLAIPVSELKKYL